MTELEIAAWSLWVDSINWDVSELILEDFLFVTAFQTKVD
jgi:hypothetical protein